MITRDELLQMVAAAKFAAPFSYLINAAYAKGASDEREACAKLCDEHFNFAYYPYEYDTNLSDSIRARSKS